MKNIRALSGIRTRDARRLVAADLDYTATELTIRVYYNVYYNKLYIKSLQV